MQENNDLRMEHANIYIHRQYVRDRKLSDVSNPERQETKDASDTERQETKDDIIYVRTEKSTSQSGDFEPSQSSDCGSSERTSTKKGKRKQGKEDHSKSQDLCK